MKRIITATEASRHFAEVLDAVEHRRQTFTVTRGGRAVTSIGPPAGGSARELKRVLRRYRPDTAWARELRELRGDLPQLLLR